MKNFYKSLGKRIKKLRDEADLSQEKFSQMLKMKRVSISQIENGVRKLTAEEIAKIAKLFNISTDALLNLEEDIKVILEEGKKITPKKKREIRISVPQKNVEKFKEVLLYILNKVGSKPNIGETVIYKILYLII